MKFIDYVAISIKAGNGGKGCIAFLREKFRPKGGPCGGDGGNGGEILFKVDQNLATLQDISLKKHYVAENGMHGRGKNMHGKNGKDVIILVPPCTIIKNQKPQQQYLIHIDAADASLRVELGVRRIIKKKL